jgi:hypothetical protein
MKPLLTRDFAIPMAGAVLITAGYAWLARDGAPEAGGAVGRALGIAGFTLMLATQCLYTLRKRLKALGGRLSWWLKAHVFMGIVGSYLALLHTAGQFHGLAGVLAGITVVMVLSGFIGRFIYTGASRTIAGEELDQRELIQQRQAALERLRQLGFDARAEVLQAGPCRGSGIAIVRRIHQWRHRRRIRAALASLTAEQWDHAAEIHELLELCLQRELEARALLAGRRLLAVWHMSHVPLGTVMVTLGVIHVVSALYYSH